MPIDLDGKQITGLKKILALIDPGSLTKEEFVKAFENVVKLVLETEKNIISKNDNAVLLRKMFDELKVRLESSTNDNISKANASLKSFIDSAMKEHKDGMDFMEEKVRSLKNGEDGSPGLPGKNGSPDTARQIRNKLEMLNGDERLEIKAIRDLQEKLDESAEKIGKRVLFGGGGFSKMAMDSRIIDPYTPTGTINGVNADFTLSKTPNPSTSLKVFRNGIKQQLTTDYTLSGTTITFLIVPVVGEILEVEHRV